MLKQMFLCVLSLSLSGALTGLLILIIRPVTKRFLSKSWNYYIWLLVVARLMIPVYVEMDFWHITLPIPSDGIQAQKEIQEFGGMPGQSNALEPTETLEPAEKPGTFDGKESAQLNRTEAQEADFEVTSNKTIPRQTNLWQAAGILWLLGAFLILTIKIKDYQNFAYHVKKEWMPVLDSQVLAVENEICKRLHVRKTPQIYETKAIFAPITIGLIRPVIVLPKEEKDIAQLPIIFHHELIHVKRRDLWYKWIYQILLGIHWFNPMLYLIGRKLNTDCELSCDEMVLACLTKEGKKAYGNILLDAAQKSISAGRRIPSITLLERKQDLKERLKGILQYKKKSGIKVLLSIFLSVGLIALSACSSIEAGEDTMPVHIAGESWDGEYDSFWDEAVSWMMDSGLDSFLAESVYVDKNGEAWRAYEDDTLIAGEDLLDQYHVYSYRGGQRIECNGMFLNGTDSVLIVNAPKETEVQVKSAFTVLSGKFKLIHVLPDGTVEVINEAGEKDTVGITMEEGRNVVKFVGQGAKVRDLNVSFSLKEKDFDAVFYSEGSEKAEEIKERIKTGKISKEEVMEHLYDLEDEDLSQAFAQLLKQGEIFDKDELLYIIIYSDSELSGRYLAEAVKNGEVEVPAELTISEIKYYLGEESLEQLLLALGDEITFDILYDCAPYLSQNGLEKCLTQYMEAGNQLTGLQFQKISVYMDEDTLDKIKI